MYPTVMQEIARQRMEAQREEATAWRLRAAWKQARRPASECYPPVPIAESAEVAEYAAAQRVAAYEDASAVPARRGHVDGGR
jgi:hypothetical protein